MSAIQTGALPDFEWQLDSITARFWVVAIVFFGVGDLTTTTFGLSTGALVEVGPLAAPVLERFGIAALGAMKVLGLSMSYIIWQPTRMR